MGTDIHPAVEVRRKGTWRYHQPKDDCPYYWETEYKANPVTGNPERYYTLDGDGNRIKSKWACSCKYRLPEFFWQRNYGWFAILANVRNDDDESWPYIQEYRDLPFDITPRARARMSDEHNQGWVLLRELQDYSFTQLVKTYNGNEVPVACEVPIIEVIQYLEKLIPKGGTSDDVRLVFDFDS